MSSKEKVKKKKEPIQWLTKTVPLKSLKAFDRNPRRITEDQYRKLGESIEEDGYSQRIMIDEGALVLSGHQRIRKLKELGYKEVEVLYPNQPLTEHQKKRVSLRANHNNGIFDLDILTNDYELEELREIGLHEVVKIAPVDFDEDEPEPKKKSGGGREVTAVCCPDCGSTFDIEGNEA